MNKQEKQTNSQATDNGIVVARGKRVGGRNG